jgi:thiamine transporter ThiT
MRLTTLQVALVVLLFAGCLAVFVLVSPGSLHPVLAAPPIVPVVLSALFWGLLPGLAAGLVATLTAVLVEEFVNPVRMPDMATLGSMFSSAWDAWWAA